MEPGRHRDVIQFGLNGKIQVVEGEKAFLTLSDYLRYEKCLTGTKVTCAEGDCGACTVLMWSPRQSDDSFYAVNSCITPLFNLDGCQILTVEGIGTPENLHPVQKSMLDCHGAQCGFCTPGFVCAMVGLAEESQKQNLKQISEKKARNHLTGNLCRCTGYEPILKAACDLDLQSIQPTKDRADISSAIKELSSSSNEAIAIQTKDRQFFAPSSWDDAFQLKAQYPTAKIVAGSTDLGVVVNKGRFAYQNTLSLAKIFETQECSLDGDRIRVGARVSLTHLEKFIEDHIPELKDLLRIFASPQIKNQGTLVGNLVNASPIGDTIPAMLILNGELIIGSVHGQRRVALKDFYLGYKVLDLKPNEIVMAVEFDRLQDGEWSRLFKVSVRKDLDISAVTMAIRITTTSNQERFIIAFGGVGPTVKRIYDFEKQGYDWLKQLSTMQDSLKAQSINDFFGHLSAQLSQQIQPLSDLRASKEYRMKVAQNLMIKAGREFCEMMGIK